MNERYTGHEQDDSDFQFTQRFIDATSSVSEYNQRHADIGPQLGNVIHAIAAKEFKLDYEEPQASPEEQAQMERELIQIIQKDELESMGISLYEKKSYNNFKIYTSLDNRRVPIGLFMTITDDEKFKHTLYGLKPTEEQREMTEKQIAKLLDSTIEVF